MLILYSATIINTQMNSRHLPSANLAAETPTRLRSDSLSVAQFRSFVGPWLRKRKQCECRSYTVRGAAVTHYNFESHPAWGMTFEMMQNPERGKDHEARLRDLNRSQNRCQRTTIPRSNRPHCYIVQSEDFFRAASNIQYPCFVLTLMQMSAQS